MRRRPLARPAAPAGRPRDADAEPMPTAYAAEPFRMDLYYDGDHEAEVVRKATHGRCKARWDR
jgi:hypothetical protein